MTQENQTDLSPANVLAEAEKMLIENPQAFPAGTTVESILVLNLKRWNGMLTASRKDLNAFRVTAKATGLLLSKLKVKRLDADRKGGGAATSRLTKEINSGRQIINESRELLAETRAQRNHNTAMRNAVLDALRLHYTQNQG